MRLAPVLALVLAVACAHSPTPLPGPRPLGNDATLARGEATLSLRYRYDLKADGAVELLIDLAGAGTGTVGTVELAVTAIGFDIAGSPTWSGPVEAGTATTQRVLLRPTADFGEVTVKHGIAGAAAGEPAVFRFMRTDDQIRPCQPSEEGCRPAT